MPIGNRNWKSVGALTALVLMMFTTAVIPEMTVNAGNSYAASESAAATADERKNETSLTNELYARAAVLMDAENGRILFSKNGDEVLPMASTTKIMTCVLALETGKSGGRPAGFFLCGEAAEGTYGRAEGRVLPDGGSPLRADAGIL